MRSQRYRCFDTDIFKAFVPKEITYNWAITQVLTTSEQLEAGIRYFDYRTMPLRPNREDLYNAHSLYGPSTEYEMMQIWNFIR